MPKKSGVVGYLRIAVVALQILCVFLGLGASSAFAAVARAGGSCPCDAGALSLHIEDGHRAETSQESGALHDASPPCDDEGHEHDPCDDSDAPCEEPCPEGCSSCRCCPAALLLLPSWAVPSLAVPWSLTHLYAPASAPAHGEPGGVYRPPRAWA